MVSLITDVGKIAALKRIFGMTQDPFTYMGLGKSSSTPTGANLTLGTECVSGTETGYARVAVTNEIDLVNKKCVSSATFLETNISVSTTIKEIGLFTASTGGDLFGISQIPDTIKDGTKALKFKATTTVV